MISTIRKTLLYSLILCLTQACSMFSETPSKDAFLTGEIVNPLCDNIVLEKDSRPIDTISLDSLNRFQYFIKNVDLGLYTFTHGSERQNIFLEPGDSTVIYANTKEFDNSLYFSGKGAEKNNFLMNMYLINEYNNQLVLSYYKIKPEKFLLKIDSLKQDKLNKLNGLQEKNNFSEEFMTLAKTGVNYEYYDLKERYTYLIHKYNPDYIPLFPEDFHDYRSKIDFDNEEMEHYYGYLRLIDNYLKNMSIENCEVTDISCKSLYSYKNIKNRLLLLDSLTDNEEITTSYFTRLGAQAITVAQKEEDIDAIVKLLETEELSKDKLQGLKIISAIQSVYLPGRNLPTTKVYNSKGEKIPLRSIVKKPTIFYNWSFLSPIHSESTHAMVAELQVKYPEIDFIGINIDHGDSGSWLKTIQKKNYDLKNEYQIITSIDRSLLTYFLNKIMFVDASGKVIAGDAKIENPDFESRIIKFLNTKSGNKNLVVSTE